MNSYAVLEQSCGIGFDMNKASNAMAERDEVDKELCQVCAEPLYGKLCGFCKTVECYVCGDETDAVTAHDKWFDMDSSYVDIHVCPNCHTRPVWMQ